MSDLSLAEAPHRTRGSARVAQATRPSSVTAERRPAHSLPRPHRLRRFVVPVALILLWQIGSASGLIPARTLAAPSAILATAWDLTRSGELPWHLLVSLARVAAGAAIGVALGVTLGLIAGLSRLGEDAVDATMQMLRALPFLALVPLFILWFGIGETPKVALVALGVLFPVYLNLFAGIRGVDPKLIEAGRVFGLNRRGLVRHVVLPGALSSALVGLRYALGVAWLSLVVAEQVNAQSGIGYLINDARDFLRTDVILVGLLTYALLGLGADALVRLLERRLLAWRPALVRS
jgi:sulfonate transport system permease protein